MGNPVFPNSVITHQEVLVPFYVQCWEAIDSLYSCIKAILNMNVTAFFTLQNNMI